MSSTNSLTSGLYRGIQLGTSRSGLRERLHLDRGAVMNEILAGDDHLLMSGQSLDNFNAVRLPQTDVHIDPLGFAVLYDIHILGIFQPADRIDGNLNRLTVRAHQGFDSREHAP